MTKKRKIILLSILVACSSLLFAQNKDYSEVDKFSKKVPRPISMSYRLLTHYLTDRYPDDEDKVRSISVWILNNIRYDVKMFVKDKRRKRSPGKIVRKRKAICQGYSDLFVAMCEEAGIEARVIVGYDKGGTYEPGDIFVRDDHAWNAVRVNGGWELLDLTWSAGYIEFKKQKFRRLLNFYLALPFKQKYRFVTQPTFKYYFTPPELFAIDHLPVYPWWQLGKTKSIIEFEKDTLSRPNREKYIYAPPAPGSIPSIDISEAPIDFLNRANIAFEFNNKNYRTLAEGRTMYAYKLYNEALKSNELDDSSKIEIFDSCKLIIDEAKKNVIEYIKYTSLERDIRKSKNKKYHTGSKSVISNNIKRINKEIRENYYMIHNIKRQVEKLKRENKKIVDQNKFINSYEMPDREDLPSQESTLEEFSDHTTKCNDSMDFLSKKVMVLEVSQRQKYNSLSQYKFAIGSLIQEDEGLIYQKIMWRLFFNWNNKFYLDSLQHLYMVTSNEKDSVHQLYSFTLNQNLNLFNELKNYSTDNRTNFRNKLKYVSKFYASCTKGLLDSLNIADSCFNIKQKWLEENRLEMNRNKKAIEMLNHERFAVTVLTKKLRKEKRHTYKENRAEAVRYKNYARYYFQFYRRERKKAMQNFNYLVRLKRRVQGSSSKSKDRIRMELKKEKRSK